jgi:Ca-activated chloride channel family protein
MPGVPLSAQQEETEQALSLTPAHGWAVPTDQVPDADAVSPLQYPGPGSDAAPHNPIEITARLDVGMPLASIDASYHEIAMTRRAGIYAVRLANGVSEMDRDFLLQWQPVSGSTPTAALFTEEVEGVHYGLLMLLPPSPQRASTPMPREIVFVVDTSGSMGGVSIRQARQSLDEALRQLRPQDSFNIIAFNSSHRALYREPVPATSHHIQQATEFVRHLSASGGTEMMPALLAALGKQREPDQLQQQAALRQVIFITDGAVGNEAALFERISAQLGRNRLFTVGIGSAPNSWFMRKAAQYGRGTYTYIGDVGEVAGKMSALFGQLSRPAAVDIDVEWPAAVDAWPQRLPDLYLGEPLLLAARFGETLPAGDVTVRGTLAGKDWRTDLAIPGNTDPSHRVDHPGVASLWAKYKIQSLLDEKARGRADQEVRAEVLPVALEHQLISPYTSFVAVEERISRPDPETLESKPVPNSRPRGQSAQPFAYPNTATTARAQIWLGGLALLIALFVRVTRQEELLHAG